MSNNSSVMLCGEYEYPPRGLFCSVSWIIYIRATKRLCSIKYPLERKDKRLINPPFAFHKMRRNGPREREALSSNFFFVLFLHATKIFTHVGVVIPRVPATCTKLASFREVVHVRVTKSVSTYNMKRS